MSRRFVITLLAAWVLSGCAARWELQEARSQLKTDTRESVAEVSRKLGHELVDASHERLETKARIDSLERWRKEMSEQAAELYKRSETDEVRHRHLEAERKAEAAARNETIQKLRQSLAQQVAAINATLETLKARMAEAFADHKEEMKAEQQQLITQYENVIQLNRAVLTGLLEAISRGLAELTPERREAEWAQALQQMLRDASLQLEIHGQTVADRQAEAVGPPPATQGAAW